MITKKRNIFFLFSLLPLFFFNSFSLPKAITPSKTLQCNRHLDSLALVEFYQKTNGDKWKAKWDLKKPMNTWFGVVMNDGGCVKCLDLDGDPNCSWKKNGGNNIEGLLPDLNLPYLEHLFLRGNKLSGSIPNFTKLQNLLTLQLSCNKLSGAIPDFDHLEKLVSLELDYNRLSGTIPTLRKLNNLQSFFIDYNQLSGKLPNFKLPSLRLFFCRFNQLEGAIPNFKHTPELQKIALQANKLEGELPAFTHLKKLNFINLAQNSLEGNIPSFKGMSTLKTINLSDNYFTHCDQMKTNENLSLVVTGNQLSFEDLVYNKQYFSKDENYINQTLLSNDTLLSITTGEDVLVHLPVDDHIATNTYTWYKDDVLLEKIKGDNMLLIENFNDSKEGVYYCHITNTELGKLTIHSPLYIMQSAEVVEEIEALEVVEHQMLKDKDKFFVSGGISPNGDGANDYFVVSALEKNPDLYPDNEVAIFSQQGQLVYRKKGYCNSWSGTYMNTNRPLPFGIYVWVVQLDARTTKTGMLVIKR